MQRLRVLRVGGLAPRLRAASARALSSKPSGWDRVSGPVDGEVPTLRDDAHLFPDHVAEEEKTGLSQGLPMVRESEVYANPNMLLPERHELWWDDGCAEPEWFIDRGSAGGADGGRPWALPTSTAASHLAIAFGSIAFFFGGGAWLLNDNLRSAVPRHQLGGAAHAFPPETLESFGLKAAGDAEEEDDEDDE